MNAINLVETLMDVNQWSSMFPGIVSHPFIVDVFSTGVAGNYNGTLQSDACGVSSTLSTSAYPRELLHEILQATFRLNMGFC